MKVRKACFWWERSGVSRKKEKGKRKKEKGRKENPIFHYLLIGCIHLQGNRKKK